MKVDDTIVEAMVMVKEPGATSWRGLGSKQFRVLPRVGDSIGMDVEGVGYLYQVVSVHHPIDLAATAGDVYAVRRGMLVDELGELFRSERAPG